MYVNNIILNELKRIVDDSKILTLDTSSWPEPDEVGKQELEMFVDGKKYHIKTCKFGSFVDIKNSSDPQGIPVFHYLL